MTATLRALDSKVLVDRAESSDIAERCLASPIHYDATFVLDSIELRPDETFADLHARLSVGRTPPPMVAIITSASDGETRPIERFIPVAVDASTLNLRRLISALRTARELHRSSRLDQLLAVLRADLAPDEQGRVPLQSALDSLRDAIDVLGAHLLITSEADSVQWEVASGDDLDPEDHSASRQPVSTGFTPVLAVRRTTPSLSAALLLGPLSANSQARIRPGLVAFVDLILERIQLASERRASEREGIVHQLFDDGAEANVVIGRSSRRRAPDPTTESALRLRQALTDGLPQLAPAVIDALLRHDLTLVHQPIMDSTGRIIESDMLLGAPLPLPQAAGHAETIDLLPLDSLESEAAAMVTSEVAIPIGHWLITRALPTLQRLQTDHELEPEHRVHLALLHRQLAAGGTVELIAAQLARLDLPPASIAIDVAEPTLIEHHDTISAMSQLAELGVALYLDGFGGAGSNFTLLRTSLVRGVKLSRDVVRGVSADERQASIVSGLVALCDELGLEIIATGVDHRADLAWLTQYPHVKLQGALVGPAMTEAELHGDTVKQAS
ncbi:MAG: EAL domain-containing protein [Acidimicrobiales bacterium]